MKSHFGGEGGEDLFGVSREGRDGPTVTLMTVSLRVTLANWKEKLSFEMTSWSGGTLPLASSPTVFCLTITGVIIHPLSRIDCHQESEGPCLAVEIETEFDQTSETEFDQTTPSC